MNRVTPGQFRKHLRAILDSGFRIGSPSELIALLHREAHRDPFLLRSDKNIASPVFLTFDDGMLDLFYHAFPIADSLGIKGIIFVVAGYLDRYNLWDSTFGFPRKHLGINELRSLSKMGWLIGSHSMTHRDLRRLSHSELLKEVRDSKALLEDVLGVEVTLFSYPFGLADKRVSNALKEAGYKGGFISFDRNSHPNPWLYPRIPVYLIDYGIQWKTQNFLPFRLFFSMEVNFAKMGSLLSAWVKHRSPLLRRLSGMGEQDIQ